jgi:hypothetical protein
MILIILTSLSLLFFFAIQAQITITDAYFPQAGDTLKTAFDGMPSGIVINPPGGSTDQSWDFSSVQGVSRQVVYLPASEGDASAEFPSADLVILLDPVGETYYKTTATTFELIGYQGLDPANLGITLLVHFNPSLIERRAPLNFIDFGSSSSAILIPFAADDIPGGILDSLPITPDSIRLRVAIDRSYVVDGWGMATIPGGTYDVLREKQIEERETFMDAKIGIGPFSQWVDVTDLLPDMGFLGTDTTTTYTFYNDVEKEAIAIVTVDNEDNDIVNAVEYKDNGIQTNIRYVNTGKADLIAYPNPAIDDVRVDFFNLPSSEYTLKIYNILGMVVWEKEYTLSGNRSEKISLTNLRKGTYLYSLVNNTGKIISTKRLMIMRP